MRGCARKDLAALLVSNQLNSYSNGVGRAIHWYPINLIRILMGLGEQAGPEQSGGAL